MRRRICAGIVTTAAALALTGCGSGDQDGSPTVTAGTSGAQVEIGNTINYGSFGTTADLDCGEGKSLNIGGADNKVTFERVDNELTVVGLNNTVTYQQGEPTVNDTGTNNSISQG